MAAWAATLRTFECRPARSTRSAGARRRYLDRQGPDKITFVVDGREILAHKSESTSAFRVWCSAFACNKTDTASFCWGFCVAERREAAAELHRVLLDTGSPTAPTPEVHLLEFPGNGAPPRTVIEALELIFTKKLLLEAPPPRHLRWHLIHCVAWLLQAEHCPGRLFGSAGHRVSLSLIIGRTGAVRLQSPVRAGCCGRAYSVLVVQFSNCSKFNIGSPCKWAMPYRRTRVSGSLSDINGAGGGMIEWAGYALREKNDPRRMDAQPGGGASWFFVMYLIYCEVRRATNRWRTVPGLEDP